MQKNRMHYILGPRITSFVANITRMPPDDRQTVSRRRAILIVEDNDLTLRFFQDFLEINNFSVLTTTSGERVVELAREQRPDLILLDIQLPDISGMEVARRLKADDLTRAIPIIAATALAMSGDRRKILASGCDDYIAKPFKGEDLLNLIERHTN